jgi:hypothetical protein
MKETIIPTKRFVFVCRLFYAGACEGQMPEILTMIQIKKMTPTPAVLCMVGVPCFLFMFSPNKML